MEQCSDCGTSLEKRVVCGRQSWRCPSCERVLVGFAVLKQTHKRLVTRLHYRSSKYNRMSPYHCVACGKPWQRVFDDDYQGYIELCKICQWAWLPSNFEEKLGSEEKNWNEVDPYQQSMNHHNDRVNEAYRELRKEFGVAQLKGVKFQHREKYSITRRFLRALSDDPKADARDLIDYLAWLTHAAMIVGLGYYAFEYVALL